MASENSTAPVVVGAGERGDRDEYEEKKGDSHGSASEGTAERDLGDKFKCLNLRADEEEDVVLVEDREELEKDAEFMALGRVHTSRTFSHGALFGAMRSAWNLAQDVVFRAIENNLFSVRSSCLADWKRVFKDGPWIFRNCSVLMAAYNAWSEPRETVLNTYQAWVRVMGLKEKMRTGSIAKQLAVKADVVEGVDERSIYIMQNI